MVYSACNKSPLIISCQISGFSQIVMTNSLYMSNGKSLINVPTLNEWPTNLSKTDLVVQKVPPIEVMW